MRRQRDKDISKDHFEVVEKCLRSWNMGAHCGASCASGKLAASFPFSIFFVKRFQTLRVQCVSVLFVSFCPCVGPA